MKKNNLPIHPYLFTFADAIGRQDIDDIAQRAEQGLARKEIMINPFLLKTFKKEGKRNKLDILFFFDCASKNPCNQLSKLTYCAFFALNIVGLIVLIAIILPFFLCD